MSLGSLGMARSAPATALLLLLLVLLHVAQGNPRPGQQGIELFHHEKIEVTEGQDVSLPCILRNNTSDVFLANMEWKKGRDKAIKLLVYNPKFETVYYWKNITLQMDNNGMDSHLNLHGVTSRDSGIYMCVLSTFPLGNIIRETELKIREPHVEVECDVERLLEVEAGGNVSIRCEAAPGSRYMWTKGNSLVSENSSLELWRVTEAHAGLYNLTVHTGDQEDGRSQHKVFFISVQQATTSRADPGSVSVPSTSTMEVTATATHLTTLTPANDLFTVDVTQNMTTTVNVTDDFGVVNATTSKDVTSQQNYTQPSTTPYPPTYTEQHLTGNSSDWQINQTLLTIGTSPFTEETPSSDPYTGYTTAPFNSTQEASSQSEPEVFTSTSLENSTQVDFPGDLVVFEEADTGGLQYHLLLLLMIVPLLILIGVVGFHCRRQIIKQRMDLPPPFKPPPPPVKYTAARHRDVLTATNARSNGTII